MAVTYGLTRMILKEINGQNGGHPPENLAVVAGSVAFDGCATVALGIAALAETAILPLEIVVDGYKLIHNKFRRK